MLSVVLLLLQGRMFDSTTRTMSSCGCLVTVLSFLTATAVSAQQQYFRVQPHDVKVQEGGEALLECEVGNLAGQVQWTKDGFALGFLTIIPGFPRYSVIGDRNHGVYNLRISNASLEDDAEYQCQVGPARLQKAIRANAQLTVISPPSSVEILDHPHNSKIEIKEKEQLTLECRVRNAKPAAKIVWYRGNIALNIPNREDDTIEVSSKVGIKKVTRFDTHSRITITPTSEDDYAEYTCEAHQEALSPDVPMRTSVHLSVLYPPGQPYIEGYSEGETVRKGTTVELVCKSRGGNPPAQLIWYKNGEQIRMAYRTAGRVSENVYAFTAEAGDNKSRYKCEASNIMSVKPLKAEIDLTVLFSPAHVTITGPTEARVGDIVPLTCTTANSNPPADIKWMVGGRQMRNATSRTTVSPDGGWITISNITVQVEPNKKSLVVICHGVNMQLTENVVSTHTINVLYPPSQPFIHGYTKGTSVPVGTVQRISCTSSGGNPLATMTWYRNDKKINSKIKTTEKSVTAEIEILTNYTDNESRYRCEATNPATEIPLFETITMSVYFPPETVKIRIEPEVLKPGVEATLICDCSSSNPPAKLSWWKEGIPVQSLSNSTKPGLHGGKVSSIDLKLNITEDMNGIVYTCQASNDVLQISAHQAFPLKVFYKPVFEKNIEEEVNGIEGEPLIITLQANGNPTSITYTWTKDGLPVAQMASSSGMDRIVSDGPILNITKLNRHDAGTYTCEALNSQGSSVAQVNVSVEYPATIMSVSENVVVNPEEDATLWCSVSGNPLKDDTVVWKRSAFDFEGRTVITYDKNNRTSWLQIKRVTRDDLGEFQCVAQNGIGNSSVRDVMLIVKHKPEMDKSPALQKFASDTGNSGRLICRTRASPLPRYSWARNGSPIAANVSGKYYITFRQIDMLTSESILILSHVTSSDYGNYECVAKNELGFATNTLRLEITSAPDPPETLTVLNVTHDSATLSWSPGFDGGMEVRYRIRYRKINENGYKYEDVMTPNVTYYVIKGLETDTAYTFSIMASNKLGESKYLPDLVTAKTTNKVPSPYPSQSNDATFKDFPGILLIMGTVFGTALILLNVLLIGCCLHRRSKKRVRAHFADNVEKVIPDDLLEKQDLPRIVIITVSVIGVVLLSVNIGLVAGCIFKKHAKRIREQSNQNSKSATIEMYAPSSYNDTVTGETLSSLSEKSETYSNEGSNDYVDESRKQATSTYLMEHQDYNAAYTAYPGYEMQIQPSMLKTHTLPHPHHQQHIDKTRPRDDQNLHYHTGNLSAKSSYISAPSPAPPADGSYFNVADRYLSYPPSLDFPNHDHHHHRVPGPPAVPPFPQQVALAPSPLPVTQNGSLIRGSGGQKGLGTASIVPPPDVLHNTSQGAQNISQKKQEMSSFGYYSANEPQDGHLV